MFKFPSNNEFLSELKNTIAELKSPFIEMD